VMLRMIANSRNAVPHSLLCLLSSFQRPSATPRTEKTTLESSLERRGVARTTVRFKEGGFYIEPSVFVKSCSSNFARTVSRREGEDVYTRSPRPSSLRGDFFFATPARREGASTPLSGSRQALPNRFVRPSRRGCFYAPPRVPSRERTEELRALLPGLSRSAGASSTAPAEPRQAPVLLTAFRRTDRAARRDARSTCPPPRCQQRGTKKV
jgi:hypothetical protein